MRKTTVLLLFIIILAVFLRFYKLGATPASLNWDEASIGYDAYSILKTGKDQFGRFLPSTFQSLNDFKPPLYIYLTVPSIALFGFNEFAVRLPSAIFGVISMVILYFFCIEFFPDNKLKRKVGLLASFFLCISPWHLQFSRTAFESNIGTSLILLAILFLAKALKEPLHYFWSSIFFSLSILAYHSAKIISLVLLFFFMLNYYLVAVRKKIFSYYFLALILPFVVFIVLSFASKNSFARFTTINAFQMDELIMKSSLYADTDKQIGHEFVDKIFHNRRFVLFNFESFKIFTSNYINHFSPDFWLKGDNSNMYHAFDYGLLFPSQIFLFIIGIIILFQNKPSKHTFAFLTILLISPIPSSMVWTTSMAVRAHLMCPLFQIIVAIGLLFITSKIKKNFIIIFVIISAVMCSFPFYLHNYFVHTNYDLAKDWFFEKQQAALELNKIKDSYRHIIISNVRNDRPSLWLFYFKYDPVRYLSEGGSKDEDQRSREKFDKISFRTITFKEGLKDPKTLLVGYPGDFAPRTIKILKNKNRIILYPKTLKTFYYPNGEIGMQFAENIFYTKELLPNE